MCRKTKSLWAQHSRSDAPGLYEELRGCAEKENLVAEPQCGSWTTCGQVHFSLNTVRNVIREGPER